MNTRTRAGFVGVMLAAALALAPMPAARGADEAELRDQLESARSGRDWTAVGDLAKQLLALKADDWHYNRALAESLFHGGQFQDAVAAYQKAVSLASNDKDAGTARAASDMLIDEGDCLLKLQRFQDAVEAYDKAAPAQADPSKIYFNICLVEYNHGFKDAALIYAEKTIKSDPKNADAYYIKGSVLAGKTAWSEDAQKYVVPEGAVQALTKFLELKPNSPRANEVRNTIKILQEQ